MIPNRYPGKCMSCGQHINESEGFAYKNGAKWSQVCSYSACHRKLGLSESKTSESRKLLADGHIIMGYDAAALPLLRSMPGAKWDANSKQWIVSILPKDLPRVVEVAKQLNMNIAPELIAKANAGTEDSRIALARADRLRVDGKTLFPFQKEGVKFLALHDKALLADEMGTGKEQPISEPVLTPSGWRPIGTIKVGDFVIGSSGTPVKVTGIFPQGVKQIWEVRFSDGATTRCGIDHLWAVQTPNDRFRKPSKFRIHSLEKLNLDKFFDKNQNSKWFIPVVKPVEFDEKNLPIHPYLLGALLANGTFANSIIHSGDEQQRSAMLQYLPNGLNFVLVDKKAPANYRITHGNSGKENAIVSAIRNLGLAHKKSPEKFIPGIYMLGSVEQRYFLLQGLVDNDGTVSKDGMVVEYNTTSPFLAEQVIELVRSLGGTAIESTRIPKFEYKGEIKEGLLDHRIRIKMPSGMCPVSIPRKRERYVEPTKYQVARSFVGSRVVGEEESVCIKVDAEDHLYITKDYIVTHNTVQSLVALPEKDSVIIICPAIVKYNWRDEIRMWRPEFKATICEGRDSFMFPEPGSITILNGDILPPWLLPKDEEKSANLTEEQIQKLSQCTLIVDECFPGYTQILTDKGLLTIKEIVENAIPVSVMSYNGNIGEWKRILRWIKKPLTGNLVRVIHEFGEFICTERHNVWTEEGYTEAKNTCGKSLRTVPQALSNKEKGQGHSSVLFSNMFIKAQQCSTGYSGEDREQASKAIHYEAMRNLQGELFYSISRKRESSKTFLQHELFGQMENVTARDCECDPFKKKGSDNQGERAERSFGFSKDVSEQSYEESRNSREDAPKTNWPHFLSTGREWEVNGASKETSCCIGAGWLHGVCNPNSTGQRSIHITSASIQGGYCSSYPYVSNRSGWQDSQAKEMEVSRQEKNFSFRSSRVVSVEVLERGSDDRSSNGYGEDSFVYDLEIEDNHNYIADGVLVSNCHQYKNYKASRSRKVKELSKAAKVVWFLTGTPLMNRPQDLYGILEAGHMNALGSWFKFVELFNGYKNGYGGYEFGMPSPEVPERMKRIMLRRLKSEVLKDLPPKTYQRIEVSGLSKDLITRLNDFVLASAVREGLIDKDDVTPKLLKDKAMVEELASKLEMTELPAFKEFSEIRALLAEARIPAMLEEVESHEESDTPLIVFSAHRLPILELGKRKGWEIITGDTSPETRRDIVHEFQDGKLKGIGLTIAAGGVGITLTHASNVLFVDLDWTPALNLQAEDRCVRIGQTANKVLIKRMSSSHPLDRHMQELIEYKVELAHKALEGMIEYKAGVNPNIQLKEETDEELTERIKVAGAKAEHLGKDFYKHKLTSIIDRESQKVKDVPEPILTPERKQLLRDALDYMSGRCDGAQKRDGQGFNKPDAILSQWIERTGLEEGDDVSYRVLERILARYRKQLKNRFEGIWAK